jgi:hypothetical protein
MARQVYKGATFRGRLLGLQRSNGGWLAVVQAFSTSAGQDPIVTALQPIDALKGSARRKADRWLKELA